MPDLSTSTARSLPGAQTIDLNEYPAYGTSPADYKLWFDYIYDWFGATRTRWLRRYLVSAGIGVGVFLLGLVIIEIASFFGILVSGTSSLTPAQIVEPIGFYVREPTAYIISFNMAYALHALRWLSQTYHVRTNRLRACFTITDEEYRKLVQPLASYAANPRRLRLAIVVIVIACAYFLVYTFGPAPLRDLLGLIYPHAVPLTWRGAYGIPTLCVVLFFTCLIVLVCFTAFHLTNTLIYLSRTLQRDAAEDSLHIQPLPSLIEDRFDGILDLSLAGVLQCVGGIVLLEWLYRAQIDLVGVVLVGAAIVQGGLLFFAPRIAARSIVGVARNRLFLQFISKEGAQRQAVGMGGELLNLATLSWDDLSERSEVMRAEIASRSATITLVGVLGLLASWALSVVLPVVNAFNLDRQVLQAAGQLLHRLLPLP